jgi:hypothetical protein
MIFAFFSAAIVEPASRFYVECRPHVLRRRFHGGNWFPLVDCPVPTYYYGFSNGNLVLRCCRPIVTEEKVETTVSSSAAVFLPLLGSGMLLFLYYWFASIELILMIYACLLAFVCIGTHCASETTVWLCCPICACGCTVQVCARTLCITYYSSLYVEALGIKW